MISGTDPIRLMDVISLNSYFHTGEGTYDAFVIGIEPNIYEAVVTLTLFMFKPPGQFSVLCDPFKNALMAGRDITGWSIENDKQRDAGMAGTTRPTGANIDDAGTAPRDINCNDWGE